MEHTHTLTPNCFLHKYLWEELLSTLWASWAFSASSVTPWISLWIKKKVQLYIRDQNIIFFIFCILKWTKAKHNEGWLSSCHYVSSERENHKIKTDIDYTEILSENKTKRRMGRDKAKQEGFNLCEDLCISFTMLQCSSDMQNMITFLQWLNTKCYNMRSPSTLGLT